MCNAGHILNDQDACTPCAANQIVEDNNCQDCTGSEIPTVDRLGCMNCPSDQISTDNTMCMNCMTQGHVPNTDQDGCVGMLYNWKLYCK